MSSPVLSPADHDHFLQHGWVVVRQVAAPAVIDAAVAALERGSFTGTVGAADYQPVSSDAVAPCYGPRAQAAMSELFGETYTLAPTFAGCDMPRPHEPDKPWSVGGHVDDDYPTLMPAGWALGCFLFLTPVRTHGGAFIYYDGSANRFRAAGLRQLSCIKHASSGEAIGIPPTEFLARPGDMLLFHHLGGHSGSPNVTDPRTRHALLSRHHPRGRVVPGDKPFEQMSTIEKANSSRYLRERLGIDVPHLNLPCVADGSPHDWAGVRSVPTQRREHGARHGTPAAPPVSPRAACAFHFQGHIRLLTVDPAQPEVITQWASDDFARWRPAPGDDASAATIAPGVGAIDSIRVYAERGNVRLFVSGSDRGGATATLSSDDMTTWQREGQSPARAAAGHFTTDYGSKVARGFVLFELDADGRTITARCAPKWRDVHAAPASVIACRAPEETRIVDFEHAPTFGESRFAVIADVASTDGHIRPMTSSGGDSVAFAGAWTPLAWTTPAPPRHIRVLGRARNYWLVACLCGTDAANDQGSRLCWAVIDWEEKTPTLRHAESVNDLRRALQVIGLM